jgi:hypothetical protein
VAVGSAVWGFLSSTLGVTVLSILEDVICLEASHIPEASRTTAAAARTGSHHAGLRTLGNGLGGAGRNFFKNASNSESSFAIFIPLLHSLLLHKNGHSLSQLG